MYPYSPATRFDHDYYANGVQHLARVMGRARALEVMLSTEDYDAELADRYGWISRALPASKLDDLVRSLAHRIAGFPAAGHIAVKDRVNAIGLAPAEGFVATPISSASACATPTRKAEHAPR